MVKKDKHTYKKSDSKKNNAESSKNGKTESNKTAKFHKERSKTLLWKLASLLLVAFIILMIVINWQSIIAPFKDAALDVSGGGFPMQLPGSTEYYLDEMGDNFYLMTDTYVYTYNSAGAQITSVQHGYQNPVTESNSKRVLVYDKNGKEFSLYSKTSEIYKIPTDDSIVFGAIGSDERCAVVTTSTSYSNLLFVFNDEGNRIFRWASVENKIMQVAFSEDERSIFVTCAGVEGGELKLYLYRFDLNNEEGYIWRTLLGGDITLSLERTSKGLYVVTSGGSMLVDENSGDIMSECSFSNELQMLPTGGNIRTVVFSDSSTNGSTIKAYTDSLEVYASVDIPGADAVCTEGDRVYVLDSSNLYIYNSQLEPLDVKELDEAYSDMIVIGSSAYLISYNSVQKVDL